jgi:hypothetical protein
MSATMTAREIGEAWLEYVTDRFLLENGCMRAEVQQEYQSLEASGDLTTYRGLWRNYTDELIDKILNSPAEERGCLLASTDAKSLAYVQDRIQVGTELLTAMAQKGLKLTTEEGAASLPDFFHQVLLQNQAT